MVTDPKHLWDPEAGLLTIGANAIKEPGKLPFPNTVYRKMKDAGTRYDCHIELYNDSAELIVNQYCEFGLMGDYSLDMPQKSFKFRSKSKYGSKTFDAKLFPDRDYTEYKGFVLRNSGNDCMFTRLQDGFQQHLMDLMGYAVAAPRIGAPGLEALRGIPERPVLGPYEPAGADGQIHDRPVRGTDL